jgi:hypothetical protein
MKQKIPERLKGLKPSFEMYLSRPEEETTGLQIPLKKNTSELPDY